jgi:hypothetical protein
MRRRQLVKALPFSIAGGFLGAVTTEAQEQRRALTPDRYDDFAIWLDAARESALELIAISGADDTERFMQFLALWTTAMPEIPEPEWQEIAGANARLDAATVSLGRPFVVTALRFASGCVLPAHCHPGGGGVSLCTNGSLSIRHFDLLEGSADFSETGSVAEVEAVSTTLLRSRQFTEFTPTRANLHELEAGPGGATVVDVIVQWRRAGEFSFLKFQGGPSVTRDSVGRRRSGTWVGMDISRAYASAA